MRRYFSGKEVNKGIVIDGIEVIPPISETTLRNARQKRQIKYTRISRECKYQLEWLEDFLNRNIVEVKAD